MNDLQRLEKEFAELEAKKAVLLNKINVLKSKRQGSFSQLTFTEAEKIALFRSLFKGRNDVYPKRFESRKTGKSGYQPVCANEWIPGVCQKPSSGRSSIVTVIIKPPICLAR